MNNPLSQSELSPEATAPDNLVVAGADGALPQSPPAHSSEGESAEPRLDAPSDPPPSEVPIAPVQPPVALLVPGMADHVLLENRIERLETELALLRSTAKADAPLVSQPTPSVVRRSAGVWSRLVGASRPAQGTIPPSTLPSLVPPSVRHTWLLLDALTELRAIYWMFFDPRYHLSWTARLAPLVFLAFILTSYYWMPGAWTPFFVGTIIEKLCDLILAYLLFKLLSYEARRYRETAPDLPSSLRL